MGTHEYLIIGGVKDVKERMVFDIIKHASSTAAIVSLLMRNCEVFDAIFDRPLSVKRLDQNKWIGGRYGIRIVVSLERFYEDGNTGTGTFFFKVLHKWLGLNNTAVGEISYETIGPDTVFLHGYGEVDLPGVFGLLPSRTRYRIRKVAEDIAEFGSRGAEKLYKDFDKCLEKVDNPAKQMLIDIKSDLLKLNSEKWFDKDLLLSMLKELEMRYSNELIMDIRQSVKLIDVDPFMAMVNNRKVVENICRKLFITWNVDIPDKTTLGFLIDRILKNFSSQVPSYVIRYMRMASDLGGFGAHNFNELQPEGNKTATQDAIISTLVSGKTMEWYLDMCTKQTEI